MKKTAIKFFALLLVLTIAISGHSVVSAETTAPPESGSKLAIASQGGQSASIFGSRRSEDPLTANRDALLTVMFVVLAGISISSAFYALLKQA